MAPSGQTERRIAQASQLSTPHARSETRTRRGKHGPRGGTAEAEMSAETTGLPKEEAPQTTCEEGRARHESSCASTEDREEASGSVSPGSSERETVDLDGEKIDVEDGLNREKAAKIKEALTIDHVFSPFECTFIEFLIDQMVAYAKAGGFEGPYTIDASELRSKYFFGNGYTYGQGQRGREALLPLGAVDPIPAWIEQFVVFPMVQRGILPAGWVNSAVVNDYQAGGCIVSHVDPPQLFDRPIVTVSFFDPGSLVFGASFDPERSVPPIYKQLCPRGHSCQINGYAADEVTHGMRPEDMTGSRRVSIVLRHVRDDAPKVRPDTPMSMQERSNLIRHVQGQWRDATSHFFYDVQSLRVMVHKVVGAAEDDESSPSSMIETKLSATWNLQPNQFGLICNGTMLDDLGLEGNSTLFWRRQHFQRQANNVNDGITWHRLEDDLASRLDVFARNK